MLPSRALLIIGAIWFIACVVTLGMMGFGAGPTLPGGIAMALLGVMATTVVVRIFRGAPPKTVAEVLYDTDHPRQDR